MIRPINKDILLLRRPSVPATRADVPVADDLLDTLRESADRCVGMAANMIGVSVRIIVFSDGGTLCEMFNPTITDRGGAFDTEEGCLSLDGTRPTRRYRSIVVTWQDRKFKLHKKMFTGWTAQIIQHEIDHLDGIII
ncbi:MAG: peptide deformylase [Clostridia bacterium]|nr:peptide deformylase [Clostridia bacterium]